MSTFFKRFAILIGFLSYILLSPSHALAASVDGSKSSLSTNPSQVYANNNDTSTVTVTLKDTDGNAVTSGTVTISLTNSATVDQGSISLGSAGTAVFTVRSSTVATSTVSVILDGTTVSNLSGQIVFTTPLTPTSTPTPTPLNYCGDTAPDAPTLVSAVSTGAHSIKLTWTEPSNTLTYYLLVFGQKSGSYEYGSPNIGAKGTTSYTVGNLATGTTYYFKVEAVNGCKPGTYSNELSAKAGSVAATPTVASTADTIEDDATVQHVADETITPTEESPTPEATPEPEKSEGGSGLSTTHVVLLITIPGVLLGIGAVAYLLYTKRKPNTTDAEPHADDLSHQTEEP
jgi:hypothetical protein